MSSRTNVGTQTAIPAVAWLMAISVAGCGSQAGAPPAPVEADEPIVDATEPEMPLTDIDEDALRAAEEARTATLTERIHFDFDQAAIRPDMRAALDAKVRVLRDHPAIRLTIEGHADDRGSTEYNLALGSRRANSVLEYFLAFGLDPDRFQTLSFGEERPLVTGAGEASWRMNRRAEFNLIGRAVANR